MSRTTTLIKGAGLGIALMYLLDPNSGRRRRALIRDKLSSAVHQVGDAANTTACDLSNRLDGLVAAVRSRLRPAEPSDEVLMERVRAHIGRVVSHPGAIFVTTSDGRVTLSGPILADEVDRLLADVRSVPGVHEVVNDLEVHEHPGDVPGLQGYPHLQPRFELFQTNWSPTTRLLVGTAGVLLTASSARRGGVLGVALGAVGLALIGRALTNLPFSRLVGIGAGRRAVDVQKTVNVEAPVERVFALWSHPETFPRFMEHVEEVRRVGPDRYRWTVAGPLGTRFTWEAEVTKVVPNQLIAWRSVEGATVQQAGGVRFESKPGGVTRLDIKMSYDPPGGALGNLVAYLLGSDAKQEMDDDLVRLKSLIETGRTTAHGEKVTRDQVTAEVAPGAGESSRG